MMTKSGRFSASTRQRCFAALPLLLDLLPLGDVEERDDGAVEGTVRIEDGLGTEDRPRDLARGLADAERAGPAACPVVSTIATGYSAAGKGEPSSRIVSGSKSVMKRFVSSSKRMPEDAQRVRVRAANRAVPRDVDDAAGHRVEDAPNELLALVECLDVARCRPPWL